MVNDPDAIWKPGYDGPPPTVGAARAPVGEQSRERADRAEHDERVRADASGESRGAAGDGAAHTTRPSARQVAVGAGLALVLSAALVVLDPLGSRDESTTEEGVDEAITVERSSSVAEPPDGSVFGGPAARRLPADAATLWSVDIQHEGDHWVEVLRRDLVVAAVAEPSASTLDADAPVAPVTTVIALDALEGEQRWTLRLDGEPRDVTVVGVVDDVLVLERPGVAGPIVSGVDVSTGETRWTADAAPNGGHVGLIGTPFVARLPSSPDQFVTLIDATSGTDVGTIASDQMAAGRPGGWSTAGGGTWQVIDDGVLLEYDLRATLGDATVVGRVDDVSAPRIVVDDRLAVVDDSGSLAFEGGNASRSVTVSAEVPRMVRSLTPVSDSAFVVSAPGSIAGVGVESDAADVTWLRLDGVIVDHHPVVGGSLIELATRGGAAMQLIDGLTGETVEHLTMVPGALQALVVAGDGAVVLRMADVGTRLAGIDLHGTERWSILGSAPVVLGDRIAVRATSSDVVADDSPRSSQQLRITAYGDVE